jgi:hypothetical protein
MDLMVVNIFIAAAAESKMVSQDRVQAEAGRGIIGDRYHSETGTFSRKLEGQVPDSVETEHRLG